MQLLQDVTRPVPNANKPEMLVQVTSTSLNPADYKIAEMGFLTNALVSTPASPGMDFSGHVVSLGADTDLFSVGDRVFGRIDPAQFGALGEFIIATYDGCARLPGSVQPDEGAAIGTAGLTAYQTIAPNVKAGDKVFINGGSGGTGAFGIQIAKALGCHVTTSCSTSKVELCRGYGADEIIDYTKEDVTKRLTEHGLVYSLVVDNVGSSPSDLYTGADGFLLPTGKFVHVGGSASMATVKTYMSRLLVPRVLGGGSRKFEPYMTHNSRDDLTQIAKWVVEGKVKVPVGKVFEYEDAPKAYELLKAGTIGKVVVHVSKQ